MSAPENRRGFLRNLISIPLLSGGVTLIGRPAAPVPIVDAIGAPLLGGPRERARYAWAAFSAAMWEIVPADAHGWLINCGGARRAYEPEDAVLRARWGPHLKGGTFLHPHSIHYVHEPERLCPWLVVERHREVAL